jgi:DNA-binding transcriptional LysR family regulator
MASFITAFNGKQIMHGFPIKEEAFMFQLTSMEPTARALELAPDISTGLAHIGAALDSKVFTPSNALRTFRIAATDFTAVMVLPRIVGKIARSAPNIDLRIFPFSRMDVIRHLDEGRIDFVMGWFGDLADRMRRTTIIVDTEAIVVRAGHPLTQAPVTKERLFSFPHIVVELTGTEDQAVDGFVTGVSFGGFGSNG